MKKFIIRLLLGIGMVIVLISAFSGILVFKRNLNVPKVQASPGPACVVNDELKITGSRLKITGKDGAGYAWIMGGETEGKDNAIAIIDADGDGRDDVEIGGKLNVGCIGVEGGCLDGGQKKKCSNSAKDCRCDSGKDIAEVICPDGYYVIAGGCDSDSGTVGLSHNTWTGNPPNGWYCNWAGGVGWERAKAICCRIQENWDPTLKSMPSGGT